VSKIVTDIPHEKYFLIGIDGLYTNKNSLVAIQNVTYPESVLQLNCDNSFSKVTTIKSLASGIKEFDSPTTGVIVDGYLYFISNSQLLQIMGSQGKVKDPDSLKETVILRIKLD
jgi:hypothetical protein